MNYFEQLKEIRTLLVDDDEFIRDSLSIAFKNKGCFMRTAETAEEGLQALHEESFDLIICDFRLPGKNGLEFLRSIRNSQPEILCVLITAYRDKPISSEASAMGIHEFIEKPFSVGVLIKSLGRLIETWRNN